jgi:NTP pyrophosphatase (non-canonical NTP hydrolase)
VISELTLSAIRAEAMRQDAKWGEQNHDPEVWLAILTEEVGELAQAMLADRFDSGRDEKMHDSHHDTMEIEAIQIAAVSAQFVEFLSRRKTSGACCPDCGKPLTGGQS